MIAESNGSFVKEYPLVPERGWEADVAALEALVDDNTRAIVVNNPSNPCGSVFSDACLRGIVDVRNHTHTHRHTDTDTHTHRHTDTHTHT